MYVAAAISADDDGPGLLGGAQQLQQVDQRHFLEPALHGAPAALFRLARCRGALEVLLG